jgi:hypothetical protein
MKWGRSWKVVVKAEVRGVEVAVSAGMIRNTEMGLQVVEGSVDRGIE